MEKLGILAQNVKNSGEMLKKSSDKAELEKYRDALRAFLMYVTEKAYKVEPDTEMRLDSRKLPPLNRVKIQRERITFHNEEAVKIMEQVLSQEQAGIERLEKAGMTGGLLLDLIK